MDAFDDLLTGTVPPEAFPEEEENAEVADQPTHASVAEQSGTTKSESRSRTHSPKSASSASSDKKNSQGEEAEESRTDDNSESIKSLESRGINSDEEDGDFVEVKTPEHKNSAKADILESVGKRLTEAKEKVAGDIRHLKEDLSSQKKAAKVSKETESSPSPEIPKPATLSYRPRENSLREYPHSFYEYSYKSPTYCQICNGLLVGLWSQGYRCKYCGFDCHRGQGLGEHDDCRAEALLHPCPGPDANVKKEREKENAKLGDVIQQIRQLAENPNFIKEVTEQLDRDMKSKAKDVIVATAVDDERSKNLRRIKAVVVPFVEKIDTLTANGDLYVLTLMLGIHALAAMVQTTFTFALFLAALAPRHGFMSPQSFSLAAIHDSTVTAALHTCLAVMSGIIYYLASLFKRKNLIIERFLQDALKIDDETDLGISLSRASQIFKYLSKQALISSILSAVVSYYFWHHAQPTTWEAAALPPLAGIFVPAFLFTCCCGAVAYISYTKAPPELLLGGDDYIDVKEEMIQEEIELAVTKSNAAEKDAELENNDEIPKDTGNLRKYESTDSGIEFTSLRTEEEGKEQNASALHDALEELVPSGAILD